MRYLHVYYLSIIFAMYAMPLYLKRHPGHDSKLISGIFGLLISVVYLAGMMRAEGIDLDVYRENFDDSYENSIPDIGFRLLIDGLKALHLPFEALMLLMGVFSILAIHRLSRSFDINFVLLLLLWFMHLAVVRDFSQTRIGFAMALATFALTSTTTAARVCWYALAISMHLTAAAFVLAYELCLYLANSKNAAKRRGWMLAILAIIFLVGRSIDSLSFLDPRIEIYLNWEREGYGVPVDSYGSLMLHFGVLAMAALCRRHWLHDPRLRAIFYLEVLGITSFIAFSDVAIFAFRLSNVLVSLYALLVAHCLLALYATPGRMSATRTGALLLACLMALFLLVRPGSYEVLAAMSFS